MKSSLLFAITIIFVATGTLQAKKYRVTLESNWNQQDHLATPRSAHFSPVLAMSHNQDYSLFQQGGLSTSGLEDLAELGRTSLLQIELADARRFNQVGEVIETKNMFIRNQTSQSFEVEITPEHPYLSFASMIAPSPDWFVGLNALKLFSEETGFFSGTQRPIDLMAIDAGTELGDVGGNFSINNQANEVHEPISTLLGNGFHAPFARISIEILD
jgi:hypothetical protein